MQATITAQDAQQRHPTETAQIVAAMNTKLTKAKLPPVRAQDLAWTYDWATMIGGSAHGTIGLGLTGKAGRREASAHLGRFAPGAIVPPEVDAVRNPAPVITLATPHVAVLEIAKPRTRTTERHLVVAAYRRKGTTRLVVHQLGDIHDVPMLYTLTPEGVFWAGGLRNKAHSALMAAPEGGTWTWRNAIFERLDADAIRALVPAQPVAFLGIAHG